MREETIYVVVRSWRNASTEYGETGAYVLLGKFYFRRSDALEALKKYIESENSFAKDHHDPEMWQLYDENAPLPCYQKFENGEEDMGMISEISVMELHGVRPMWAREHETLHERKMAQSDIDAGVIKNLDDAMRTGVNAVRVFNSHNDYLGYCYLDESGAQVIESESDQKELSAETKIKNPELSTDDDGYTIMEVCLDV